MQALMLTGRVLFRFLHTGTGSTAVPVPLLKKEARFTQSEFWWSFLAAAIQESAITPYFDTSDGRPRALGNLMNRTVPHSMPRKLFRTMEDSLNAESVLNMTVWLASVINEDLNPLAIQRAITMLEDRIHRGGYDSEFSSLYGYFSSIRIPEDVSEASQMKKLYLQAMFRFSMLGLHAIYGDLMLESEALKNLRETRLFDPDTLWDSALEFVPRLRQNGFSFAKAAVKRLEREEPQPPDISADDTALLERITETARKALPSVPLREEHADANAGWYVVANWMDFCVNVNDSPRSTYVGARELDTVPNGTLLYVLSAPGYRGLHVSSGVWGKILWQGSIAWVPMNLLIRVKVGESMGDESGRNGTA